MPSHFEPLTPGLVRAVRSDPLLCRDPVVMTCLDYHRHGGCSLESAVLTALHELVERNNKLLEMNLELQARLPMTFLLPAMN